MIDLSAEPPPHNSSTLRMPRRQLLLSALCGFIGGSGGAWVIMSLAAPDRLNTAAHGIAAVEPAGAPGTFVDLATVGPAVTVSIGRSGRCSITVGATIAYGSTDDGVLSQGGAMSFEATGANQRPPSLDRAGRSFLSLSGVEVPFSVTQTIAATIVLDGLRPGRTTFTAKYRAEGGSPVPVFFSDRTILATPLAAETS
jgi:hypothetical protein